MPSFVFFLFATFFPSVWLMDQKALDEFVKLPDPHYNYTVHETFFPLFLEQFTFINLTSQKWLDVPIHVKVDRWQFVCCDLVWISFGLQASLESKVDKPIWRHILAIVVPKIKILQNSCLLILRPDRSDEPSPYPILYALLSDLLALKLRSVVAVLMPLPVQPLTFYDHPLKRKNITGHDLIAYSWWKFINDPTAPPHSLVQFPMVKATVRAMDTIVAYMKEQYDREITNFTLTGITMGGWISWLTAAVDKRVKAIMPIGMDFLNFRKSFYHQYRAYCGWSYMMRPFYEMKITQELEHPRFRELASHVDPLAYNERYKNIIKSIVVFAGDALFLPDNSRYYFSQLEGVKFLRIIRSTDYLFKPSRVFGQDLVSFYRRIVEKNRLPKFSWEIKMTNTSGTIIVRSSIANQVFSYYADTVDGRRRDFRFKEAAGNTSQKSRVKWIQSHLHAVEKNVYKLEMQKPEKGWRAFYIEVVYPWDSVDTSFITTSEMVIIPYSFPCPDRNAKLV